MADYCEQLHQLVSTAPVFRFPFDKKTLPRNGIYILFEKGETGHGQNRIVRVGTHTGQNNLGTRLGEHFLKENKDRSIFRKNIGRALLNRDSDPFLEHWQYDLTTRKARETLSPKVDFEMQKRVERSVTEYISEAFFFCVIPVETKEQRLDWEAKMLGTISDCKQCKASPQWLGRASPNAPIRESGLWNVLGLYGAGLNEGDISVLRSLL